MEDIESYWIQDSPRTHANKGKVQIHDALCTQSRSMAGVLKQQSAYILYLDNAYSVHTASIVYCIDRVV